jgi:hypothetical protein
VSEDDGLPASQIRALLECGRVTGRVVDGFLNRFSNTQSLTNVTNGELPEGPRLQGEWHQWFSHKSKVTISERECRSAFIPYL